MSPAAPPSCGVWLTRGSGFTLIEVLVAIVLVAIGVLAAVGSSAVIVREQDNGRAATLAAAIAVNRLESLRSHPCGQESGTAPAPKGMVEWWTEAPSSAGVRTLSDSVSFATAGTARVFVLRAQAWC